jgi:hypothetical protein
VIAWPSVQQHHRGTVTAPLVRKTESVHRKGLLHGTSISARGSPALDRRPLCRQALRPRVLPALGRTAHDSRQMRVGSRPAREWEGTHHERGMPAPGTCSDANARVLRRSAHEHTVRLSQRSGMALSAVVGIRAAQPTMRALIRAAGAGANRVVTLPTEATQRGRAVCVLLVGHRIGHGPPPFPMESSAAPAQFGERRAARGRRPSRHEPPVHLVLLVGQQPHSRSPGKNSETPRIPPMLAAPNYPRFLTSKILRRGQQLVKPSGDLSGRHSARPRTRPQIHASASRLLV